MHYRARPDLCGGRVATRVPTAIAEPIELRNAKRLNSTLGINQCGFRIKLRLDNGCFFIQNPKGLHLIEYVSGDWKCRNYKLFPREAAKPSV